jgi:hypothetical protein
MPSAALPHLPLELVLLIILYADRRTLLAFTQVSKACSVAAEQQLYRKASLNPYQLIHLLNGLIADIGDGDEATLPNDVSYASPDTVRDTVRDTVSNSAPNSLPNTKILRHLKSIEELELIEYHAPWIPVGLVHRAAVVAGG